MTIHDGRHATPPAQRLRRSPAARETPLRSASKVFRPTRAERDTRDARVEYSDQAAHDTRVPAQRAVEAAVDLAYRVYEDYVDWGRATAANRPRGTNGTSGTSGTHGRANMRAETPDTLPATYWLQMWQEMWRMWGGYMLQFTPAIPGMAPFGSSMPGLFPTPGSTFGAPRAGSMQGQGNEGSELNLELETSQRTAITLHLTRPASGAPLKARLHREDGEGSLQLHFDASNPRIRVPEGQAPGTYSGVVRDDLGNQCGMLTVTLFEPARFA
jgi:hypothetical protein